MATWVKSCGVLIYRDRPQREFLLMRHADRWDLPKGHIDEGETELECALRELQEETGIDRQAVQMDDSFRYSYDYTFRSRKSGKMCQKTLVVFLGVLLQDIEIVPSEHSSFAWQTWSPPHQIQAQTIDPLLAALEKHWQPQ